MVARILSLGVALGLVTLASSGLSPLSAAHAAYPGFGFAAQAKRPQFRPWDRAEHYAVTARWRPNPTLSARRAVVASAARRPYAAPTVKRAYPAVFGRTIGSVRYATAVTPVQRNGVRFRPAQGQSSHLGGMEPHSKLSMGSYQSSLQSQFRPPRVARKTTYEELHALNPSPQRPVTVGQYPSLPALPMPVYAGYWPTW